MTDYDELVQTAIKDGFKRDFVLGQKEALVSIQGVLLSEILTASEQRDLNSAYDKKVFMEESGKLDVLHRFRDFVSKLSTEITQGLLEPDACTEDAIFRTLKDETPSQERLEQIEKLLSNESGIVTKYNRGEVLINLMRKWNAELNRSGIDYYVDEGATGNWRVESFTSIANGVESFGVAEGRIDE